jgi:hypothetical protein
MAISIHLDYSATACDSLGCKNSTCAVVSNKKRGFGLDPFPGRDMKLGLNRVVKELNGCKKLSIAGKQGESSQ